MAGTHSAFDQLALDAAERIEEARALGKQLTLLPDEAETGEADRAKRGRGKITSQLREWLSAKGYRLPEDVLVEMAGLSSRDDAFTFAMSKAELVLAWAQDGAVGAKGAPVAPSTAQRLDVFKFVFTAALRAAEAALPYGLGKVTADVQVTQAVQIVMPAAQGAGRGPETARDVTPQARRMGPPPMPTQTQRNQQVSEADTAGRVGEARTE